MAKPAHLEILRQGVNAWNKWRDNNPKLIPDLQAADLREYDLVGIDFSKMNLLKTNLQGVNLRQSNLQDSDLTETNLQGANFDSANLRGAAFYSRHPKRIEDSVANVQDAVFINADLRKARLQNMDLQGLNFENANLRHALLIKTNLQETNLQKAQLIGANLADCQLQKADLQEAKLRAAIFHGASLDGACLEKTDMQWADLEGVSLTNTIIHETNFQKANLIRVDLSNQNLKGVNFSGAKCEEANFSKTNITDATFRNADMRGINLIKSTMDKTDFQGANLSGSILTDATLNDVWFTSRDITTEISPAMTKEQISGAIFLDQAITVATSSVAKLSERTLRSRRNLLMVASLLLIWSMGVRLISVIKNGSIQSSGITQEVILIVLGLVGLFFLIQFIVLALEDYEAWKLTKTNVALPDGKQTNIHYHRTELIDFTNILHNYKSKAHRRFWLLDLGLPLFLVALSLIGLWIIPHLIWWEVPQPTNTSNSAIVQLEGEVTPTKHIGTKYQSQSGEAANNSTKPTTPQ